LTYHLSARPDGTGWFRCRVTAECGSGSRPGPLSGSDSARRWPKSSLRSDWLRVSAGLQCSRRQTPDRRTIDNQEWRQRVSTENTCVLQPLCSLGRVFIFSVLVSVTSVQCTRSRFSSLTANESPSSWLSPLCATRLPGVPLQSFGHKLFKIAELEAIPGQLSSLWFQQ